MATFELSHRFAPIGQVVTVTVTPFNPGTNFTGRLTYNGSTQFGPDITFAFPSDINPIAKNFTLSTDISLGNPTFTLTQDGSGASIPQQIIYVAKVNVPVLTQSTGTQVITIDLPNPTNISSYTLETLSVSQDMNPVATFDASSLSFSAGIDYGTYTKYEVYHNGNELALTYPALGTYTISSRLSLTLNPDVYSTNLLADTTVNILLTPVYAYPCGSQFPVIIQTTGDILTDNGSGSVNINGQSYTVANVSKTSSGNTYTYQLQTYSSGFVAPSTNGYYNMVISYTISGSQRETSLPFYSLCQANECNTGITIAIPEAGANDYVPEVAFSTLSINGEIYGNIDATQNPTTISTQDVNTETNRLSNGDYDATLAGVISGINVPITYTARITVEGDCDPIVITGPQYVFTGQEATYALSKSNTATSVNLILKQTGTNYPLASGVALDANNSTYVQVTFPSTIVGDATIEVEIVDGTGIASPFNVGISNFIIPIIPELSAGNVLTLQLPNSMTSPGDLSVGGLFYNGTQDTRCPDLQLSLYSGAISNDNYKTYLVMCGTSNYEFKYPDVNNYFLVINLSRSSPFFSESISSNMATVIDYSHAFGLPCGANIPFTLTVPNGSTVGSPTVFGINCTNPGFFAEPGVNTDTYTLTCGGTVPTSSTQLARTDISISLYINNIGTQLATAVYSLCWGNDCNQGLKLQLPGVGDEASITELIIIQGSDQLSVSAEIIVEDSVRYIVSNNINTQATTILDGDYTVNVKGLNSDNTSYSYFGNLTINGEPCRPYLTSSKIYVSAGEDFSVTINNNLADTSMKLIFGQGNNGDEIYLPNNASTSGFNPVVITYPPAYIGDTYLRAVQFGNPNGVSTTKLDLGVFYMSGLSVFSPQNYGYTIYLQELTLKYGSGNPSNLCTGNLSFGDNTYTSNYMRSIAKCDGDNIVIDYSLPGQYEITATVNNSSGGSGDQVIVSNFIDHLTTPPVVSVECGNPLPVLFYMRKGTVVEFSEVKIINVNGLTVSTCNNPSLSWVEDISSDYSAYAIQCDGYSFNAPDGNGLFTIQLQADSNASDPLSNYLFRIPLYSLCQLNACGTGITITLPGSDTDPYPAPVLASVSKMTINSQGFNFETTDLSLSQDGKIISSSTLNSRDDTLPTSPLYTVNIEGTLTSGESVVYLSRLFITGDCPPYFTGPATTEVGDTITLTILDNLNPARDFDVYLRQGSESLKVGEVKAGDATIDILIPPDILGDAFFIGAITGVDITSPFDISISSPPPPTEPEIIIPPNVKAGDPITISVVNLPPNVSVASVTIRGEGVPFTVISTTEIKISNIFFTKPDEYEIIITLEDGKKITQVFTVKEQITSILDLTICEGEVATFFFSIPTLSQAGPFTLLLANTGEEICSSLENLDFPVNFECPGTSTMSAGTYRVWARMPTAISAGGTPVVLIPSLLEFPDNLFIRDNCGATGGDPHVVCLDNSRLEIYEPGYYRLFDNLNQKDQTPFVMNAEVIRWGENKEDMYQEVYLNCDREKAKIRFSDRGLIVAYRGDIHNVGMSWSHLFTTKTGETYEVICDKHLNTIALKTNRKGEFHYGGALAGQVFTIPSLSDVRPSPDNLCLVNKYLRNAVICGSAQPHVITVDKSSLSLSTGFHRLLEVGDVMVNVHCRSDLLLSMAYIYKDKVLIKTWSWDGETHWERSGSNDEYEDDNCVIRCQSNGSISIAMKNLSLISGLIAGQESRVSLLTDISSLSYTLSTITPMTVATSLYQRLIEV